MKCDAPDCPEMADTAGKCKHHYNRAYRDGTFTRRRAPRGSAPMEKIKFRGWDVDASTGCWISRGPTSATWKHPTVTIGGKERLVSRIVLAEKLGRDLSAGEVARHTCDNPPCVNPEHLIPGTQADNIRDMDLRGRRFTALTPEKVSWLRSLPAGFSQRDAARELGIAESTASQVVNRKTWRYVD